MDQQEKDFNRKFEIPIRLQNELMNIEEAMDEVELMTVEKVLLQIDEAFISRTPAQAMKDLMESEAQLDKDKINIKINSKRY